jgi:uncharacterized protein (DUF736 family)
MTKPKTESIGAIWKGTTQRGQEKLSITIDIEGKTYKLTAFPNTFKTMDKHPDYRILPPQEGAVTPTVARPASTESSAAAAPTPTTEEVPDDIPF